MPKEIVWRKAACSSVHGHPLYFNFLPLRVSVDEPECFRQSPVLTRETISHQNMYCKNPSRNTRQLPNTSPQCRGNKTTYCVFLQEIT